MHTWVLYLYYDKHGNRNNIKTQTETKVPYLFQARMNSLAMTSSKSLTCSKFHGKNTHQLLRNTPFQLLPTDECSERLLDEIREISNAYLVRATKAHRTNVQIKAMSDDIVMAVEGAISGKYASADAIEDVLGELSVADSLAIAMSEDVIPGIEEILCYVKKILRDIHALEETYEGRHKRAESLIWRGAPATALSGSVLAGSAYAAGCAALAAGTISVAGPLALFLLCLGLHKSPQHKRTTNNLTDLTSGMNLVAQKLEEHVIALDVLNTHLRDLSNCRKKVISTGEISSQDMERIQRTASYLQKATDLYDELVKPVRQLQNGRC